MKFLDFFSGAGMFRKGMEEAGYEPVGYVEIDKHARDTYEKNYNVENEWTALDVTKIVPNEVPKANIWCFGFPCFEKDMLVMTSKGYKKIQDIESGDLVLTHDNSFQKVIFPMTNHADKIYELNIYGVDKFKATENHPFYVREMFREWNEETKSYGRFFNKPDWVEVKDLTKNHFLGIAINQEFKLPNNDTFKNLKFSKKNFWWIVGRYFKTGWYDILKNENYHAVFISLNNKETSLFRDKFEGILSGSIIAGENNNIISIPNKEFTTFLMQFGKNINERYLTSDILNLPVEFLKSFLEGYFSYEDNILSKELAYGIQSCIHKTYQKSASVSKVSIGEEIYTIKQEEEGFYDNGYIWVPFKEKNLLDYNDLVYNLEVENNNSYTVQNLITHNCKNFSTANVTTRTGLLGEQSGLFWSMYDLIKQVPEKPKHLFIENVKGFTTIHGGLDFLESLDALIELGYDIKYEVSTGMDYGVPQNRIRTYLICTLREDSLIQEEQEINIEKQKISIHGYDIHSLFKYLMENNIKVKIDWGKSGLIKNGICTVIPFEPAVINPSFSTLSSVLEEEVEEKYYLNEEQLRKVQIMKGKKERILPDGRIWKEGAVPFPDRTDKPARTVTPSDGSINRSTHVIYDGKGYRKLTIRERARLQGLPDDFDFPVSDSQASLQLGNGVMVEVIRQIAEREFKEKKEE